MSTLTGALPDSPFCGCESSDAPPPPPDDLDTPSRDTLEALHADPFAYLAGVLGGSLASTLVLPATSVGASGGVLGLLAYLAISGVGPTSSPTWMRKQMFGHLATIAATGLVGFFFIDNAAHAGGAAAGMLAGGLSATARRHSEQSARAVDTCGSVSAAILAAAAIFTAGRLLHAW